MSYSLNEIETLSKRAGRGAGLSWGMAEEAGKSVRWLTSHNLNGVGHFAALIIQNDRLSPRDMAPVSLEGVWFSASGISCPLACGAALVDCSDRFSKELEISVQNVTHPLLFVPFAGMTAQHLRAPVLIQWDVMRIVTDGTGVWIEDPVEQIETTTSANLRVSLTNVPNVPLQSAGSRGDANPQDWVCLERFAQRTFAPATEASRQLGAGAGASDND